MKRLCVMTLILTLGTGAAFGQSTGDSSVGEWDIVSYTDAYVAASSEVDDQLAKIKDLQAALETARIRRDSQLSIDQKNLELEVAKLAVREMENAVAVNAVNLYIAYVAANRDFESARDGLSTAKAEFVVTKNRFEAEEESERALLSAQVALLQAEKNLVNSESKLRQSRNALVRALDLNEDDTFIADELPTLNIEEYDIKLDQQNIMAASSKYYQASRQVELKEKELKAKSGSSVFTEAELEDLRSELEQALDSYQSAIWSLEDEIAGFETDFSSLLADIQIARINYQINETDLASTELQFEFGEILQTDRDNARQKVVSSESSQKSLNETFLKTLLSVADLNGGSVRAELESILSNN